MSKIHLKKSVENYGLITSACGILEANATSNWEDVKCENCKRTKLYKKLKADAEYKKEIKKEMEDIKKIAEWKNKFSVGDKVVIEDEESCYKAEIVEIRDDRIIIYDNCFGFDFYLYFERIESIEFQNPKFKEAPKTYKQKVEIEIEVEEGKEVFDYAIFGKSDDNCDALNIDIYTRDKVKQGADLVGCLCGVSLTNTSLAKVDAEMLHGVHLIKDYYIVNNEYRYVISSGGNYGFAYPVSEEKLKELKEALNK